MGKIITITSIALFSIFNGNVSAQSSPDQSDWNFCIQSYSFKEFTFKEALEKTKLLGIKYIEAYPGQVIGGNIEGNTHYTMDSNTRNAIKKMCEKHGIKIKCYGVVQGKDEADWINIFEFAKEMGIEIITSEPQRDHLDLVEKLADKYEINVAIHNHPKPSVYWNPKIVLKHIANRSKRIGVCADTGHWVRSKLDPVECLQKLEGRLISFHLKDLNEKDNKKAHDVIWGTGVCDIPAIIKEMKRQNFNGPISIEYEHNWLYSVPEIKLSVKNFKNIASGS
jgi:sugar phosphate isomerase/epimerase